MKSTVQFSKSKIEGLFKKLNPFLAEENVRGEMYVVGGAVMCLVFNARKATRDVDALFKPTSIMRKAILKLAQREKLPEDWINDGVKAYFSERGSFSVYAEYSHLIVHTAQADYLLAMKCLATRIGEEFEDERDIQYLLRYLNIRTIKQAVDVITQFYPEKDFPQKAFYLLEEILSKRK